VPSPFHHKDIRLPAAAYVGSKAYFVTLCAAGRHSVFTAERICECLLHLLREESAARGFAIPAYCLMPDHLHFLAEGLYPSSNLLSFVKSFRIKSSRIYAGLTSEVLWQKKFYDHILRTSVSLESVAWYIWMNPVRASLATQVGEFPFAGSFTETNPFREPPTEIWKPAGK
jgi:putative transposase